MKPAARSASSLWMTVATLNAQPGKNCPKNDGNHRKSPDTPIIPTPQNTAM